MCLTMVVSGDAWQLRNPKEKACMTDRARGGAIDPSAAVYIVSLGHGAGSFYFDMDTG